MRSILPELKQAIRRVDAQMMFLQEVVGERAGAVADLPQFEFLADEVWPHYAYGRNAIYQKGDHGNAVLSKYPFITWSNRDVSRWWFSQRGILFGELSLGVYVACIHFGLFGHERRQQLNSLFTLLTEAVPASAPLIIAGDFNDWNGKLHRQMTKNQFGEAYSDIYGQRARTFPSRLPLFSMDRIYYRNLRLIDAELLSGRPWNRLSDHCALAATFSLR
jgi:endonuclease/exonuclease/phosphatase family metal-dependent hydrolase